MVTQSHMLRITDTNPDSIHITP